MSRGWGPATNKKKETPCDGCGSSSRRVRFWLSERRASRAIFRTAWRKRRATPPGSRPSSDPGTATRTSGGVRLPAHERRRVRVGRSVEGIEDRTRRRGARRRRSRRSTVVLRNAARASRAVDYGRSRTPDRREAGFVVIPTERSAAHARRSPLPWRHRPARARGRAPAMPRLGPRRSVRPPRKPRRACPARADRGRPSDD